MKLNGDTKSFEDVFSMNVFLYEKRNIVSIIVDCACTIYTGYFNVAIFRIIMFIM